MGTLPRNVRILIGAAAALGLACVAIRVPEIADWDGRDLLAVTLIGALTIAAERCSIPLRHGSETVNFALTDGVWAGALLLVVPSVLTVAVRGLPETRAISPTKSPGPSSLTTRTPRTTSASPSTRTMNSKPLAPSLVRSRPLGRSSSSASMAISSSSRREQRSNSGTRFSSSIFAFLRSINRLQSLA